jgi:hypothetical protein
MTRKFMVLVILAGFIALNCHAEESSEGFSGFFRFNEGKRIDYSPKHPEGKVDSDTITETAVLSIHIPENSKVATFNLTYGKNSKMRSDDTWQGIVVQRGRHMLTIHCDHSWGNSAREKVSTYVIYPERGVGFCLTNSAWFGMPHLEVTSGDDPEMPFGSASILRLTRHQE